MKTSHFRYKRVKCRFQTREVGNLDGVFCYITIGEDIRTIFISLILYKSDLVKSTGFIRPGGFREKEINKEIRQVSNMLFNMCKRIDENGSEITPELLYTKVFESSFMPVEKT